MGRKRKSVVRQAVAATLAGLMTLLISCTPSFTASLGGSTPGSRGNLDIQFINDTPFRAIFTFGVYDPANSTRQPEFGQFFASTNASVRLEGNTVSPVTRFQCAREISIGGARLIQLIKDNKLAANDNALKVGISFSDAAVDSANANEPTAGRIAAGLTTIGDEFQCGSRMIYRFVPDATAEGGVRIDTTVVLP